MCSGTLGFAFPPDLSSPVFGPGFGYTQLPPAEFTIPFTAAAPRSNSTQDVLAAALGSGTTTAQAVSSRQDTPIVLDGTALDHDYWMNVTVGGQHFNLMVDLGSVDTWIVQKGFNCSDVDGNPLPEAECGWGTTGFDPAIKDVPATCEYSSGNFIAGPVGFDTVSLGGLSVTQQGMVLVTHQVMSDSTVAAWDGDDFNTGALDLAFPDDSSDDDNKLAYDPFFFTVVKQNKVKNPLVSIALNRETNTSDLGIGVLSLGGIAPVAVEANTSVTVPIQQYSTIPVASNASAGQSVWYTLKVESYTFQGGAGLVTGTPNNNETILDLGSAFNIVPTDVAAAYAATFKPPALIKSVLLTGLELVPRDHRQQDIHIDAQDQIVHAGTDDLGNELCVTGTQGGGTSDTPILGDPFLHNVVATLNLAGMRSL
ncbi:aspartic peptidase domain-containing protein [Mycena galopus ATCC 62051]|nr:aspartic peptidase domain-containing protein [Mycena galopus ATCC 62051]